MSTTDVLETSAAAEESAPRFEELGLSETVLQAVRDLGYTAPTPVQAAAIPAVLAGRDLLAAAQTGTGKTAAFLLPALNDLGHVAGRGRDRRASRGRGPLMLIVTPTRELAQQIEEVCLKIAARTGHVSVTVVGGLSYNPQKSALARGCDILVATPGRLVDLINQEACNLSEVRVLVLDEADRMLDMGFLPDVRRIVERTPAERQTLLFSATLDEGAVGAITDLVRDPARVEIAPATATADTVDQYVLPVTLEAKNALLAQVLKREGTSRVIVFCRTKHRADACCRRLARAGVKALAIHGGRSQAQRERALADFRSGRCDVLVATDVLARGIDVPEVRYVVNFDVPSDPTDYIHRIGRTGRAGEEGWSLTFVTEQDLDDFRAVEALMGKTAQGFDAAGLALGEHPPYLDPERVPSAAPAKKKTKRGKSTSKKKPRRASDRAASASGADAAAPAPRPARPKRAGRARVRENVPASGSAAHVEAPVADDGARASAAPAAGAKGERAAARSRSGISRSAAGRAGGVSSASRTRREEGAGRHASRAIGRRDRADAGARGAAGSKRGHDWRNSDLLTEREQRMGNIAQGARTGAAGRLAPGTRRRTRRPGDGGGRRG